MQGKTWKVKYEKADELISRRECFGWNFMSKSTGGPGHKIAVAMNRDKTVPNYKKLRKLEKQYNKINRSFPLDALIFALMGIAFIIPWLFKFNDIARISLLSTGISLVFIAVFLLIVFFLIKPKKKKLSKDILKEAAVISNKEKLMPLPENKVAGGEHSYKIRDMILAQK